jgi:hypothetical protein
MVPKALNQQEMDIVLQAVGRVRPYTSPREVITFQCAAHPGMPYTQEFNTLDEARAFFNIPTRRDHSRKENSRKVQEAREKCLSQRQTAAEFGLSLRTVKRYWKLARGP